MCRFGVGVLTAAAAIAIAGCAIEPTGPMVRVLPGPYKPFRVFQQDQAECADYAQQQIAGEAEAANNRALGAAAIGTVLGLGVGAATGSGRAATAGAAIGGATGAAIGASGSEREGFGIQRRYDIAYAQCMYARGNQVPGFAPPSNTPPPPPPPGGGRSRPPPPYPD
jgi:uncharacterized protein YcfJ